MKKLIAIIICLISVFFLSSTKIHAEEKYGCWLRGRVFNCPKYPQYEWIETNEDTGETVIIRTDKDGHVVDESTAHFDDSRVQENIKETKTIRCNRLWNVFVRCKNSDSVELMTIIRKMDNLEKRACYMADEEKHLDPSIRHHLSYSDFLKECSTW